MKCFRCCLFFFFLFAAFFVTRADTIVYLHENFEDPALGGAIPSGWTEEGTQEWRIQRGGDDPVLIPNTNARTPNTDHTLMLSDTGMNATFAYQSLNDTGILITKPIDLEFAVKPELRFWHAQAARSVFETKYWDRSKIFYRLCESCSWKLLVQYNDSTFQTEWVKRTVQLPDTNVSDFYLGFAAYANLGHGVCLDDISVYETEIIPRRIVAVTYTQASTDFIPAGVDNNLVLRINIQVFGNMGTLQLDSVSIKSLCSDHGDIKSNGVKVFATEENIFSMDNQLGSSQSFSGDIASFNNLEHNLITGDNYFWVTFDVEASAQHNNIIDAAIPAFGIKVNDTILPEIEQSPIGERRVSEVIFRDDFDGDEGWELSGEFEIAEPQGLGSASSDPTIARNGTRVLGTDLTGSDSINGIPNKYPGDYRDSLPSNAYLAVSPLFDLTYYKDVQIWYYEWLNVNASDKVFIDVSSDNGKTWKRVYQNSFLVSANSWTLRKLDVSSDLSRKDSVRIRFGVGPTESHASGWNIDNFMIVGDHIKKDVGVVGWSLPESGCVKPGSEAQQVKVSIKNFAELPTIDTIPVMYQFAGEVNKTVVDTLFQSIPVGGTVEFTFSETVDLTSPYLYKEWELHTETLFPGDQDNSNDAHEKTIGVIPTYDIPYEQDFEDGEDFWIETNKDEMNVWQWGILDFTRSIQYAASGMMVWTTNVSGNYPNNDSSFLESPCFNLSYAKNPILEFKHWMHITDTNDGFTVQYSLDEGETWENISQHAYPFYWNWHQNNSVNALNTYGWSDTTGGYLLAKQLLPAAIANNPLVKFRFLLMSDDVFNSDGVAIDDVRVYEAPVDIGVTQLVYPYDTCDLSSTQEVVLAIKNYGIDTLHIGDSFMVEVAVNNEQWQRDTVFMAKNVPVGDTFHYQLSGTFDMYLAGNYSISAYTVSFVDDNIYADTLYNNDSIFDSVLVYKPFVYFGPDIFTVRPDTIVLDAFSDEGNLYTWQDFSTDSVFHVGDSGLYYVEVLNPSTLCTARDTIYIHRLVIDMEVSDWHGIASDCEIGDSVPISMELTNVGTDTIRYGYVIDFTYEVEDVAAVRETWVVPDTVKIAPDSSFIYTFSQALDMSAVREYSFVLYVDYPDDDDASNDTIYRQEEVYGYPDFQLSPADTVHQGFSLLLDARQGNEEWVDFAWQDESTDSVFLVTEQGTGMYYCTVTDVYGCSSSDSSRVRLVIVDVAVNEIFSPLEACGSIEGDSVYVRIINAGTDTLFPGAAIPLAYRFAALPLSHDTLHIPARFEPADTLYHIFDSLVWYPSDGIYELSVFTDLHNDSVPLNDTLLQTVTIHALPELDLGEDTTVFNQPTYTIDPGTYYAYQWSGGSADSVFVVDYKNWLQRVYLTITDTNHCQASDDIKVDLDFLNLAIDTVLMHDTICVLEEGEPVNIVIANKGTQVIQGYHYYYSFNEMDTVEVQGTSSLGFLATRQHTIYANAEEHATGSFSLYVNVEVSDHLYDDVVPEDDTISRDYFLYGPPDVVWPVSDDTLALTAEFPYTLGLEIPYTSYVWGDSVSTDSQLVVQQDGWYRVEVIDDKGCQNRDSIYVLGYIGIDHQMYETVTVDYYPVPAHDVLYLNVSVESPRQFVLSVNDMQGKQVYNKLLNIESELSQLIDISNFSTGTYILLLRGEKMMYRGKIIVE